MLSDTRDYKGHRQRLKKKLAESGVDAFHDYEVVELTLLCPARRDVKPLVKDLLRQFGSLKGIMDAERASLEKVCGIGTHAAILLRLIKETGTLYLKEKVKEKPQITCTSELLNYCRTYMGGFTDERFCVIYLDAQNRMTDIETIQ